MGSRAHDPQGVLVLRAQLALGMSQVKFGSLLGVSRRTIIRWGTGGHTYSRRQKAAIVQALHARDPAMADETARGFGESLESLGVGPSVAASAALPVVSAQHLGDSIVCAAAEAVALAPNVMRVALVAAFDRAAALNLSVEDVRRALVPTGVDATAKGRR